MPLDAVCVHGLVRELEKDIIGARIDRVQQPERDMLILTLRGASGTKRLLLSCGVGSARVHLTAESIENPAEPPMFCMLLRKHLTGARILSLEQPGFERLMVLTLSCRDEMGDLSEKKLVCEMIGRSSNIILVGADGRIIDCMRRMDFGGDAERRMLPGMIYSLPPEQKKIPFFTVGEDEFILPASEEGTEISKHLLASFSGLSPLICREMEYRCGGNRENLYSALLALRETVSAGELSPTLISTDGSASDYSFMSIRQYGAGAVCESFESFSALLDAFYSRRDKLERQRRRSRELMKTVKTVRDRAARKLSQQRLEYAKTDERDTVRKNAELITANIYRMKKGQRELVCQDYYLDGCPEVHIPLDPLKTPQQNAAALYKEFNRLKAAREHLAVFIAQGEKQLDYLTGVMDEIERSETEGDLSDIRRELTETGYIRKQRTGKPEKIKPQQPMRFMSDEGFEILVGRSNTQNDELTTKLARRTDYWLHTRNIHGSHVIIRCDGLEPPEKTVMQAASLAAYYSQNRDGGRTLVDITMVRNVRKPSGSLPGAVIYTDYRTVSAEGDETLAERLKVK